MVLKVGDIQFVADSKCGSRISRDDMLSDTNNQHTYCTHEQPTRITHRLLPDDICCDYGWRLPKARAVGNGLSRTARTRNEEGFKLMTRQRLVLWTASSEKMMIIPMNR
jgi:hypothetical protein